MQKKLIALAVAGLISSGAFAADNSVTVYGSFDAGLRNLSDANAAGQSLTSMDSSGTFHSNRLGFKGVEGLGNGQNAHFDLESGFTSGSGTLAGNLWGRTASVGLGGSWGSLDLGRQYTTMFQVASAYDPFNYKYTGIIPVSALDGSRRDNDVQYTGTFGALSLGTAYATGKDASNTLTTNYWTVGGAYKTGPLRVALGYGNKKADQLGGTSGETKNWWLGGSYAMTPAAALTVAYYDTKTSNVVVATTNPLGIEGQTKLFVLGGTYSMSKRTTLYAGVDHHNLEGSSVLGYGTAQTQGSQTGVSVGIDHSF